MRLSRLSYNISALIVLLVTFGACSSVTPSFPQSVNYTDGRSVTREIEAVRGLIAEKPLDALLRAKRLTLYTESTGETNTLYQDSKSAVEKLFFKDVENGEWEDALKLFHSLTALGEAPAQSVS